MKIKILEEKIRKEELKKIAQENYGDMTKGVVDIEKEIIALGGEFHSEANEILIEKGSNQENVWGFNIYPEKQKEDRLEYDSLINIKPKQGNRDVIIGSEDIKEKMKNIINNQIE